MRRVFWIIAVVAWASAAHAATLFINNQTGWNNTTLYAWAEGRADLLGGWPGIPSSSSQTINGVTYLKYTVPDNVFPAYFIFNNGGSKQLADLYIEQPSDYYLTADNSGLQMTDKPAVDTYHIYVFDRTGWDTFVLYAWGDHEAFGKWPGETVPPTKKIDGLTYYDYPFLTPAGAKSATFHLIFHNNVGEGKQGDNRQLFDITQARDYYLVVKSDGITEGKATPEEGEQPEEGELFAVDYTEPISSANRVIYELNLYDFTSQGTLAAAQERLDRLDKLGIDIIWIMPIYPRGVEGKIGSLGSPYAPRDYTAVDPQHGTIEDLTAFVAEAHRLGMSVWLDWVPNHTGLDHRWVKDHPDFYQWKNGAIVHPSDYSDVLQLNYANTELCDSMTAAMLYWVNEADIDGFRCDYISSPAIPVSYWQKAIPALQNNSRSKRVEMLGEADFVGETRLYEAGFDYDYAWRLNTAFKSIGTGTDAGLLSTKVRDALSIFTGNRYDNLATMAYLTNHDDIGNNFSDNYLTQLGDNVAPLTVMTFTLCGMPLLYNGQEIGQKKILNYFNRNTINWNTINTPLHNTIRALIALKHGCPALADGVAETRAATTWFNTGNPAVIAYEKRKEDDIVLVVLNFSDQPATCHLPAIKDATYRRVLDSETIASGFRTQYLRLTGTTTLTLPAKAYQVYVRADQNTDSTSTERVEETKRKGEKVIRNGQLYLMYKGTMYNVQGNRVI